jgi:copper chaperone NosL
MKSINPLLLLIPILLLARCGVNPEPIAFGNDYCSSCKMSIVDPKFGGELVTSKGKVFKFDAMECMVHYMHEQEETDYAHVLGIAYDVPGELHPVDNLQFVISEEYNSPMGASLAGFREAPPSNNNHEIHNWQSLINHLSNN